MSDTLGPSSRGTTRTTQVGDANPLPPTALVCDGRTSRIEAMEQVAAATGQSIVNDLQNLAGIPNNPPKLTMGWCVECHRTVNAKGIAAVHQVADLPKASVVVPPPAAAA